MDAVKDFLTKHVDEFLYEAEKVVDSLPLFWDRMERFLRQCKAAPMTMWNGTADELGNRIMLIMFLIGFVGGALYLIVCFLKESWKEKLKMLGVALVSVVMLLVIFYFALM